LTHQGLQRRGDVYAATRHDRELSRNIRDILSFLLCLVERA
jgi:hypothetical protein